MNKENLYTFSVNSWHCKFFNWCYGIQPSEAFQTMCPYFWSFLGTLLLLPIILTAKFLRVPSKTIGTFVSNQVDKCKEYHNKKLLEHDEKKYQIKLQNIVNSYLIFHNFVINPNVENASVLNILMKKKHLVFSDFYDKYMEQGNQDYNKFYEFRNLHLDIIKGYEKDLIKQKEVKARAIKIKMASTVKDNFIIKWFVIILMLTGLLLLGAGIGYLLFKTGSAIIVNIKIVSIVAVCLLLLVFAVFLIVKFFECWWNDIKNLFNWIGNRIWDFISYFSFLLKILNIFIWIGNGFKIAGGTVYAIYKEYCPIITWKT